MNKAFLSYSSADAELVNSVYRYLGHAKAIIDQKAFENGLPIVHEIEKGIDKADIVIVFLSDTALNSSWVQHEIEVSKNLFALEDPNRIVPILIDRNVDVHVDKRIPAWLKSYILRVNRRPHLIGRKIEQILRSYSLQRSTIFTKREKLFVGRNLLFDSFEEKYLSFETPELSTVVVSGYPNSGRRTFLRNAMRSTHLISKGYEPIHISFDGKDSIDGVILKIKEVIENYDDDYLLYLSELPFSEKVKELVGLLLELDSSFERIFLIDDGGIIRPNNSVPGWFLDLIGDERLQGKFVLSVISKYRVPNHILKQNPNLFEIQIPPLRLADVKKLFVGYCKVLGIHLNPDQYTKIINLITTGSPAHVHYSVEYIHQFGIHQALTNSNEISSFGEEHINSIITILEDKSAYNIKLLVLLCQFEFVSFDLLYRVVGDSNRDRTDSALQDLFVIGVYDLIGANKEYIKVNPSIYNYIVRSERKIDPVFKRRIKSAIASFVGSLEVDSRNSDFSELLFNVKGALSRGQKLPKRYYIPSFILKTVRDLYYLDNYKDVIRLIDETLENPNRVDPDLIWDFKYWLCQALAKTGDQDRFEKEVSYFSDKGYKKKKSADFFFLHGFFARNNRRPEEAETLYKKAIELNDRFARARRELVTVYLIRQEYSKALDYARENFESEKTNAFHIQSYFTCLVKKGYFTESDRRVLSDLMKRISENYNVKAPYLMDVMKEEYEFYINKNKDSAIHRLQALATSRYHRRYALFALREALKRVGRMAEYSKLERELKRVINY